MSGTSVADPILQTRKVAGCIASFAFIRRSIALFVMTTIAFTLVACIGRLSHYPCLSLMTLLIRRVACVVALRRRYLLPISYLLLSASLLHDHTAAVLLLRLGIEHLTLRTQSVRFGDQAIDLLASLQYRLDGLVQHNLCLVELFLDLFQKSVSSFQNSLPTAYACSHLHDTIRRLRILILNNILLQLRKWHLPIAALPC